MSLSRLLRLSGGLSPHSLRALNSFRPSLSFSTATTEEDDLGFSNMVQKFCSKVFVIACMCIVIVLVKKCFCAVV